MQGKTGIFYQPMSPAEHASVAVLGIPFDGTVSNRPGARFGPTAIREATLGIEDYSPYLDRDVSTVVLHDRGDLELPIGDTGKVLAAISREYRELSGQCDRVIALGGEHLVSLPLIETMHERYGDDLFLIQFDAHADLRREYLGVSRSHCSVMRHATDLIGRERVAVIGIRSGTGEEWTELRTHPNFFGPLGQKPLDAFPSFVRETLPGRKVYLTIDLDVFDPSFLPGTGTPEPGGISFRDAMAMLQALAAADIEIVGADLVELAPDYDHSGISAALAGTLLRELILLMGVA